MRRIFLLYGVVLALLVFLLKIIEYRYLVRELQIEFYIGIVAVIFTAVGVWTGIRLMNRKPAAAMPAGVDEDQLRKMGISPREREVLNLMAQGLSNQEIADKLFLSLNTVKSHSSSLFVKLDVRRRTQAVRKARGLRLIP